jgi:transposase
MVSHVMSDALWEAVRPLLPPEPPKPRGGRPRVPDKAALEGIVYVLRSGVPWRMLPKEFGCSGVTCWRRLRDWQEAGVWRRLRRLLLEKLGRLGLVDWSRASVDLASVPAKKGERRTVPIRWIAADRAPNATCSSTGKAHRSPCGSPEPMYTTRRSSRN